MQHSLIKTSQLILYCALLLMFCNRTAAAHVEEGKMPDSVAEMEYRILLEFEPDNLDVRLKLGMVLFRAEKYNEAAGEFAYVLDKNPETVDAYIGLARAKTQLGDFDKAIHLFQTALSLNVFDIHIYYYLGETFEIQGNVTAAEKIYKKGLALDIPPENKHAIEERQLLVEALNNIQAQNEKHPGRSE